MKSVKLDNNIEMPQMGYGVFLMSSPYSLPAPARLMYS